MRRSHVIRIAAVGIAVTGSLVLAEVTIRAYALVNRAFAAQMAGYDPFGIKIEPLGELGFRQKPNARLRYFNGFVATANALGYRGPPVAIPKPPGTFRVLLLGGSTTHGWGVADSATIDAHLRRIAAHRWPDRPVEVVNLAFDGYDAYQLVERLRAEGLGYEPDVIIINTGINDVRNARIPNLVDRDRRTLIWETELERLRETAERGRPRLRHVVRHYSYFVRLISLARNRMARSRGPIPDGPPPPEIDAYPAAADNFELNLGRLADMAETRGARLVFSTPPSSLLSRYDSAETSERAYWLRNAWTTQVYRDTLATRMRRVVANLEAQHYPVAYLGLTLPDSVFLDDCHLAPEGNRAMAEALADVIAPWVDPTRSADGRDDHDGRTGHPTAR